MEPLLLAAIVIGGLALVAGLSALLVRRGQFVWFRFATRLLFVSVRRLWKRGDGAMEWQSTYERSDVQNDD